MQDYVLNLLVLMSLYAVLAMTLNMLIVQAGLFSVAHAAFYGIGGYATALLTTQAAWGALAAAGAGVLLAVLVSLVVSAVSLRIHEDYLVIASFGLQVIVTSILLNWIEVTGGPMGVARIPRPELFGVQVTSREGFLALGAGLVALTLATLWRLVASPFGRTLRAIREDAVAAQSLGKNVAAFKVWAFVIAAAFAALAGSLYAHYVRFVSPADFTIHQSILVLSMVIVGGMGNLAGAAIGAALLLLVPEALRFLALPSQVLGPMQQIVYGALLIVFARLRPEGLFGERWQPRLRPRPVETVAGQEIAAAREAVEVPLGEARP